MIQDLNSIYVYLVPELIGADDPHLMFILSINGHETQNFIRVDRGMPLSAAVADAKRWLRQTFPRSIV